MLSILVPLKLLSYTVTCFAGYASIFSLFRLCLMLRANFAWLETHCRWSWKFWNTTDCFIATKHRREIFHDPLFSVVSLHSEAGRMTVFHQIANQRHCTLSFPHSAMSLPAAKVAPPARKLEWWNDPFFFWKMKKKYLNKNESSAIRKTDKQVACDRQSPLPLRHRVS